MRQNEYLVGDKFSPDNPGGGVEGELHSNWGQLQLLDGVRLAMRMFPVNMSGNARVNRLSNLKINSSLGDVNYLTENTAGGSINKNAVLVNNVDNGGDLALVGALASKDGHAANLHKLLERHRELL